MDFLRELFRVPDPKKVSRFEDEKDLIRSLHYLDVRVRQGAATGLAERGTLDAVEPLIVALKDPDERVYQAVRAALFQVLTRLKGTADHQPALAELRRSLEREKHPPLRQTVNEAIQFMETPASEPENPA